MNCSKFLGIVLIYILIAGPVSAFEIEQLWEVAPPAGQNYRHANIVWSSGDSLPHVFFLDRQDWTVYHMTPGLEFEALCTLPLSVRCFGVCMDSTLESSVLVHYHDIDPPYGRATFVNLVSGDSLYGTDFTLHYVRDEWCDYLEFWWEPSWLFCSGSRHGMMAHLYGIYEEDGEWCDMLHSGSWNKKSGRSKIWSVHDYELQNSGGMPRLHSNGFCLMGSDTILDWAISGRTWGWSYDDEWGYLQWDWQNTYVSFRNEGWNGYWIADNLMGTIVPLERTDGPAVSLLFFKDDSMAYYQRGPSHSWTVSADIHSPTWGVAFPRRIVPQRVALVYSESGSLTEIDLAGGHVLQSVEFPLNVRALQPYLAADSSWELMAVFDRYVRGYRVTGLLPADDISAASLPESYSLAAYPNPFNDAVTIVYELPRTVEVNLRIVDILGREVTTLANNRQLAGKHEVTWNAANLSSGIYFVHLEAGTATRVQKLVYLK